MMERLNATAAAAAAQVSSLYGAKMNEYGDAGVSSMMALMTAHEANGDGGSVMRSVPQHSSFSSFNGEAECFLSEAATAMFHFQGQSVREELPVSSSVPLVKTEGGFPLNLANHFELHRERAENCFAQSASMHLASPTVTSFAPRTRMSPEGDRPHFSIRTRTSTESIDEQQQQEIDTMKAKIMAHPQYPCLLEAYIECQKVGAAPEDVARLDAVSKDNENRRNRTTISVGMDPELDRFMEAYCEMLIKYQEELTKPFMEARAFFKQMETQLNSLSKGTIRITPSGENDKKTEPVPSDEEDCSTGQTEYQEIDHHSEDRDLKDHLLRKYSGYLISLKKEFMKKKKKGKLPKDARQKLLDWWNLHIKWPYPSENEKVTLAEKTGLDQKQINNWFINQRKRHWKPSEDVQFVVMDGHSPHNTAMYVERHFMSEGSAFHLDSQ